MEKFELRETILKWYDAKDNNLSDDDFLIDWVDTLIEETLSGGSDWNDEIEFIVLNCNHKIEGVRVYKGKKKNTYMATIDIPKENGKTNQMSCGTYSTIIEAIKARKNAKAKLNVGEVTQFKNLFSKYCRSEINANHCQDGDCEFCPVNKAYEVIFDNLSNNIE